MAWVHDHIFAAGGSEIPKTWDEFATQTGITAVVHLGLGRPAEFVGSPPAAFLWLNLEHETDAGHSERLLASDFIRTCLEGGQEVLLHSSLGRHRTRWLYVAFLIGSGSSVRSALRQGAEAPWLAPYHTDETAWRLFADVVKRERAGLEVRRE